jgi:hypothetical protein
MTATPNVPDHDAADPSAAFVHLVHHYRHDDNTLSWWHDSTEAYATLMDAEQAARAHGEDVDTVPIQGAALQFTPDELNVISHTIGSALALMRPTLAPSTVRALMDIRAKAAQLAFLGVVSDA